LKRLWPLGLDLVKLFCAARMCASLKGGAGLWASALTYNRIEAKRAKRFGDKPHSKHGGLIFVIG